MTFRPANLMAALGTVIGLTAMYGLLGARDGPSDWMGYQQLFDRQGGYLAEAGRDPLFVALLKAAKVVFGGNGYEGFRLLLFVAMASFAARLTYLCPTIRVSPITTALVGVAIWGIKSAVQIREGVALVFVAWGVAHALRHPKSTPFALLAGCALGYLTHQGTAPFLLAAIVGIGCLALPNRALSGWWPQRLLMVLAIGVGFAVAALCVLNARAVELALVDMTEDRNAEAIIGPLKAVFWVAQGAVMLGLRWQLIEAVRGRSKLAFAFSSVLASFVLPSLYVATAGLVATRYYLPAATAFGGRLLFTAETVALMIVALGGRGNWITLALAAALVAEQVRLMIVTAGLGV